MGEPPAIFKDSYDLQTSSGFANFYQDAFGTTLGLPRQGCPEEWIPELSWILRDSPSAPTEDPFSATILDKLFASVDIQSCFRVADPVAHSAELNKTLQHRYQRAILTAANSPGQWSNWLTPLHYRRLASKGPIDWVFLYPPLSIADLSLALAVSRARLGVAMWIPKVYLSAPSPGRLRLLTAFKVERRLAIVQDWEDDNLWVCIFASSSHRTRMLCPSSAAVLAWTSFNSKVLG